MFLVKVEGEGFQRFWEEVCKFRQGFLGAEIVGLAGIVVEAEEHGWVDFEVLQFFEVAEGGEECRLHGVYRAEVGDAEALKKWSVLDYGDG